MKYYHYISGLIDLSFLSVDKKVDLLQVKEEIFPILSKRDKKLLSSIFNYYDNKNILLLLKQPDLSVFPTNLGMCPIEEWKTLISQIKEEEVITENNIPTYLQDFLLYYLDKKEEKTDLEWEEYLNSKYYEYAMSVNNQFLSNWYEFNLNINNIATAHACRKYGLEIGNKIIGNNDIAKTIKKSNTSDFGLSNSLEYLEELLQILQEPSLLERERKIAYMRWEYLEENIFFHYFTVEKLLSYVLRLQILERWKDFDKELGKQNIMDTINQLKDSVAIKQTI